MVLFSLKFGVKECLMSFKEVIISREGNLNFIVMLVSVLWAEL